MSYMIPNEYERTLEKIKVNGQEVYLIRDVWDEENCCHWYHTTARDKPFCSLCDKIERNY